MSAVLIAEWLLLALTVAMSGLWLAVRPQRARVTVAFIVILAVLAALIAILADVVPLAATVAPVPRWTTIALTAAAAVVSGGAATLAVLTLADRQAGIPPADGRRQALRGGAWIGVLERIGIFATLAVGLPEGVALILAIKSLARYPELRTKEREGVAERFIIGTFASMAVAAGCAAALRLLLG